MTVQIAPSILSADFSALGRDIAAVERGGADLIHVDVMDGHFVPNITLGPPVVRSIRKATTLPLDAHLMIEEPDRYIEEFVRAGADMVSVHIEAVPHLHRTVHLIKKLGVKAGVVLNPATPAAALEEIAPDVFTLLDDGLAYVKEGAKVYSEPGGAEGLAVVPAGMEEATIESAEECPGECIFIEVD